MEHRRVSFFVLSVMAAALLSGCGTLLNFATNESHSVNRLEKPGDLQFSGSAHNALSGQQVYQAEAAVAVARHLAVRGSYLTGGDLKWGNEKWGKVDARHLGVGRFYTMDSASWAASTWVGYSRGAAFNENPFYRTEISQNPFAPNAVNPAVITTHNDFERWFIEQQFVYKQSGFELFGVLTLGRSSIYNFRLDGNLPPNSGYETYINEQLMRPHAFFGVLGVGISGGSPHLQVHLRVDQWLGKGAFQVNPTLSTFISTGLSWRIHAFMR